jgi:hypothetical protein
MKCSSSITTKINGWACISGCDSDRLKNHRYHPAIRVSFGRKLPAWGL